MDNRSIFYEDWRDCLRSHLAHVVRVGDTPNEASLRTVLRDTGFSEDEIEQMRAGVLAQMQAEAGYVDPPQAEVMAEFEASPVETVTEIEAPPIQDQPPTPDPFDVPLTPEAPQPQQQSLFGALLSPPPAKPSARPRRR